jgi:hypothetical protein
MGMEGSMSPRRLNSKVTFWYHNGFDFNLGCCWIHKIWKFYFVVIVEKSIVLYAAFRKIIKIETVWNMFRIKSWNAPSILACD